LACAPTWGTRKSLLCPHAWSGSPSHPGQPSWLQTLPIRQDSWERPRGSTSSQNKPHASSRPSAEGRDPRAVSPTSPEEGGAAHEDMKAVQGQTGRGTETRQGLEETRDDSWAWWLTSVIPATRKAQVGGWWTQAGLGKETQGPIQKKTKAERAKTALQVCARPSVQIPVTPKERENERWVETGKLSHQKE
jgi:hypothetical protein